MRTFWITAILLAATLIANGQPAADSLRELNDQALKFLQQSDFENAVRVLKDLTARDPRNGTAWLRLGSAEHQLGHYPAAITAWERANELEANPPIVRYNLACAHALTGNPDQAWVWLELAIEAGFAQPELLRTDADLATLRGDARFAAAVSRVDRNAHPCAFDSLYAQMDFWIGEWNVFSATGPQVGVNRITKAQHGCVVLESWTGNQGFTGQSINYVDPRTRTWKQQWVDKGGTITEYSGQWRDRAMHLLGTQTKAGGEQETARMRLTPLDDGSVHQIIEHSRDDGTTWYIWFDGVYRKTGN